MWEATDEDFKAIDAWGLAANPFRAVEDYSPTKSERRWLNPEQVAAYKKYSEDRRSWILEKDFDDYYKRARKAFDERRWRYVMNRKAWFIMPLGWDNVAKNGGRIADFGCGDGDTVQRVIEYCVDYWAKNDISDVRLEVVGFDLNADRVDNCKRFVRSPTDRIKVRFECADIISGGLGGAGDFDYALCCGVLEILDDDQCARFLDAICGHTITGLFIEDLFERFPGGNPRDNLGWWLVERGFEVRERHVVLTEPFSTERLQDPKKLWPSTLDQNLYAERLKPIR